jgi:hypothetical protein
MEGPSQPPEYPEETPSPTGGWLTPLDIGEILSTAFDLYRQQFTKLIAIAAIVIVPLQVIQYYLVNEVFGTRFGRVQVDPVTGSLTVTGGFVRSIFVLTIASLVAFLITLILLGAITRAAAGSIAGLPIEVGESYRFGLQRLGPLLLVMLLVWVSLLAGFILLVIPGIFLAVKFSVSVQSLVVENRRGTEAIGRSWELTKGHFWHVLGAFLLALIIAAAVSGIIGSIGGRSWLLEAIFTSIGQILSQPFVALVAIVIYLDLRVREENLDLPTLRAEMQRSM